MKSRLARDQLRNLIFAIDDRLPAGEMRTQLARGDGGFIVERSV